MTALPTKAEFRGVANQGEMKTQFDLLRDYLNGLFGDGGDGVENNLKLRRVTRAPGVIFENANASGDGKINYFDTDAMVFTVNGVEPGRATAVGWLFAGTSEAPATGNNEGIALRANHIAHFSAQTSAVLVNRKGSTGGLQSFYTDGSFLASIATDGSSVSYNTGSDRRLKENDRVIEAPLQRVRDTNWIAFDFIDTGIYGEGVIAQDETDRWPVATMYDDENDQWNFDYSKCVPALGAAVVEVADGLDAQQAQIDDLVSRVEALEAA